MQKTAIITGGAKGIGRAVSLAFARAGYAVAVLYHTSEAAAEALVREIETDGGRAAAIPCDVRDSASVQNAVDAVRKDLGKIDVLVNNAGISEQILFTDITDEKWADMLAVHLTGAFYMTRAVLPDMLHEKSGRIVNIASMWGETGGSCEVHYSAAKAGLIGLTKALAKELAPSGITVNAVSPGAIDTDMMRRLGAETCRAVAEDTPMERLGTPEEVAAAVLFLAGERTGYITGQILSVNGGAVI